MSEQQPLQIQARAARIARRRGAVMAGVVCALRDIQAQDHLLAQIGPSLTPAAWAAIVTELDAQDERLADAVTDTRGISEHPFPNNTTNNTDTQ